MDQRAYRRFDLDMDCKVSGAITGPFLGTIENISRGGLCLRLTKEGRTRVLPIVGEVLTVEILLPINRVYGQNALRCSGTLVRVSNDRTNGPKLAISVDQMKFSNVFRKLSLVKAGRQPRRAG